MGFTWPQYSSFCGWTSGSPYTSEVLANRTLALVLLAKPRMLSVPRVFVLMVLIQGHGGRGSNIFLQSSQIARSDWLHIWPDYHSYQLHKDMYVIWFHSSVKFPTIRFHWEAPKWMGTQIKNFQLLLCNNYVFDPNGLLEAFVHFLLNFKISGGPVLNLMKFYISILYIK